MWYLVGVRNWYGSLGTVRSERARNVSYKNRIWIIFPPRFGFGLSGDWLSDWNAFSRSTWSDWVLQQLSSSLIWQEGVTSTVCLWHLCISRNFSLSLTRRVSLHKDTRFRDSEAKNIWKGFLVRVKSLEPLGIIGHNLSLRWGPEGALVESVHPSDLFPKLSDPSVQSADVPLHEREELPLQVVFKSENEEQHKYHSKYLK